jgi:WD40 repeat protein
MTALRSLSVLLLLAVGGCHTEPWIPANIVRADAHSSGAVLAFNHDSSRLASGGKDGTVVSWGLPGGERRSRWRAHSRSVTGLGFVGPELVTSGYEGTLAIWSDEPALVSRRTVAAPVQALAVSGIRVAAAQKDGVLSLWELDGQFRPVGEWGFGAGPLNSVAAHEGSGYIAAGTAAGRVFTVGPSGEVSELEPAPGGVWALDFAPGGERLTGAGWFKLFHWDLPSGKITTVNTPHFGLINSIAYLNDGHTLASISRQTDSQVYFLDADTGVETARFQPHELCGSDVRVSQDGRYLASTSDDASVRIWDRDNPLPAQSGVRGR